MCSPSMMPGCLTPLWLCRGRVPSDLFHFSQGWKSSRCPRGGMAWRSLEKWVTELSEHPALLWSLRLTQAHLCAPGSISCAQGRMVFLTACSSSCRLGLCSWCLSGISLQPSSSRPLPLTWDLGSSSPPFLRGHSLALSATAPDPGFFSFQRKKAVTFCWFRRQWERRQEGSG